VYPTRDSTKLVCKQCEPHKNRIFVRKLPFWQLEKAAQFVLGKTL